MAGIEGVIKTIQDNIKDWPEVRVLLIETLISEYPAESLEVLQGMGYKVTKSDDENDTKPDRNANAVALLIATKAYRPWKTYIPSQMIQDMLHRSDQESGAETT